MKLLEAKVESVKMTKKVIEAIIEIDKEFYLNFDYSDVSWYFRRYSRKNKATVLLVDGKIVGYYLFYPISKALFEEIARLNFDGDYDFPESEVNAKSEIEYLPSVLVKKEFREFSPLLLKSLLKEFKQKKVVVAIAVSPEGKRMCEKFMTNMGKVKDGVFIFVKTEKNSAEKAEEIYANLPTLEI